MRYLNVLVLCLILFLLGPASLLAGPVLLCDPYPVTELQPTKFVVVLDGAARDVLPERYPDGSSRLRLDLVEITDGAHTVKVKAVNSARSLESAEVVISFRKTGLQIVPIKGEAEKRPPSRTYKGYLKDEY